MLMMEPPTETRQTGSSRPLVTYTEQYECPRCESRIPQTLVKRHEPTSDEITQGLRRVSVHCPACRTGFTASFRLQMGILVEASAIELVADAADLADVIARHERVHGTRQVRPVVPAEIVEPECFALGDPQAFLAAHREAEAQETAVSAADREYAEQQRTLDREFDQRTRWSESEPGREYLG